MKKLLFVSMLLVSISSIASDLKKFNGTRIQSITIQKELRILPGTKKTKLSDFDCYLLHDKRPDERMLSAGRKFKVVRNYAHIRSYSTNENTSEVVIQFDGLKSASILSCRTTNIWSDDLTIKDVENQLDGSVSMHLEELTEIQ